jgi:hypothetical protein
MEMGPQATSSLIEGEKTADIERIGDLNTSRIQKWLNPQSGYRFRGSSDQMPKSTMAYPASLLDLVATKQIALRETMTVTL